MYPISQARLSRFPRDGQAARVYSISDMEFSSALGTRKGSGVSGGKEIPRCLCLSIYGYRGLG